jgi:uncharacterized surface protein with fasciclin (FAS1) repeats
VSLQLTNHNAAYTILLQNKCERILQWRTMTPDQRRDMMKLAIAALTAASLMTTMPTTLAVAKARHKTTKAMPKMANAAPAAAAEATKAPPSAAPATAPAAATEVTVMDAKSSIAESLGLAPEHMLLISAMKAANLVDKLSAAGPYTVFAPVNAAFEIMPSSVAQMLMSPDHKDGLTTAVGYYVVPGLVTVADLTAQIKAGNGKATLKSLSGQPITAAFKDGKVVLTDVGGGTSTVTRADITQSNGVIHVVDAVLLPKL